MELTRESLYRVRNIFLLMVVAIFAISATYSFMNYQKLKTELANTKTLSETTKLIDLLSDVVQELQRERGMSAGYIGSGGVKFKDLLPKQRKRTDEAIQRASKFLQEFDTNKLPYLSNEKINEAFGVYLTQLNVIRKKVDNLQIPLKEELTFYTNAINDLLDAIFTLSKIAPSPETERDIVAYGTLAYAKEKEGLQRAVVSVAAANKKFPSMDLYTFFVGLVNREKAYLKTFRNTAPDDIVGVYDTTVRGEVVTKVDEIIKYALQHPFDGTIDVDPEEWFSMITQKIDLMRKVLKVVDDRLELDAHNYIVNAEKRFALSVFEVVVTMIILIGGFVYIMRHLNRMIEEKELEL